jgi:hypothetical protein
MTTNFTGWSADRINRHLDELERAVLGYPAVAPSVTAARRHRSEAEWQILARREGQEVADRLRAEEEGA